MDELQLRAKCEELEKLIAIARESAAALPNGVLKRSFVREAEYFEERLAETRRVLAGKLRLPERPDSL